MHPNVRRDLAGFGQLNHVPGGEVPSCTIGISAPSKPGHRFARWPVQQRPIGSSASTPPASAERLENAIPMLARGPVGLIRTSLFLMYDYENAAGNLAFVDWAVPPAACMVPHSRFVSMGRNPRGRRRRLMEYRGRRSSECAPAQCGGSAKWKTPSD